MIFQSGMSTAEKVTNISGRGVGMSAVKSFLQENGGDVELILSGDGEPSKRAFKTQVSLPADMSLRIL